MLYWLERSYEKYEIDFQLAPPHMHRRNTSERAIRTYKNHFISGSLTTYTYLPIRKWDWLLSQWAITLNPLINSRVNPDLSEYAHLFGPNDFNKSPMAPPGTRVVVHEKPGNQTSWGHHSTPGWYLCTFFDHYMCMQCYMPETGIVIITDTLQYIPKSFVFPKTTTEDYLQQSIGDIIAIMKNLPNTLRFLSYGDAKKMQPIRLNTSRTGAHLNHAYKFYPCHHCYHRVRVKIFNFRISPAYQYYLREWNRFLNLQGCK